MKSSIIEITQGNIILMEVDAIVNAANTTLLGGGGVDGAIHRAAGPELLDECNALNGCETGDAKITKAYNLPAKFIIHTVGPVWKDGNNKESELLSNCYKKSLELSQINDIKSIAFPSISTGAYHFPISTACRIAIKETIDYVEQNAHLSKVMFVCFSSDDLHEYQAAFEEAVNDVR